MTSMTQLSRRLDQLERSANAMTARWYTARQGVIPDDFRPGLDNLITVRFAGDPAPTWRGEPYSSPGTTTVIIGGE